MWKDNLVLTFTKKSSHLSTNLYDPVYFDHRDRFDPSMGSSHTWSDYSGQTS